MLTNNTLKEGKRKQFLKQQAKSFVVIFYKHLWWMLWNVSVLIGKQSWEKESFTPHLLFSSPPKNWVYPSKTVLAGGRFIHKNIKNRKNLRGHLCKLSMGELRKSAIAQQYFEWRRRRSDRLNIQQLILEKKRIFERRKMSMEIVMEEIKPIWETEPEILSVRVNK